MRQLDIQTDGQQARKQAKASTNRRAGSMIQQTTQTTSPDNKHVKKKEKNEKGMLCDSKPFAQKHYPCTQNRPHQPPSNATATSRTPKHNQDGQTPSSPDPQNPFPLLSAPKTGLIRGKSHRAFAAASTPAARPPANSPPLPRARSGTAPACFRGRGESV